MPDFIPPILSPYLERCAESGQTLLTTTIHDAGIWLILRLLLAAINPEPDVRSERVHPSSGYDVEPPRVRIVFASILRPLHVWTELGRKVVGSINFLGILPTC